VWISPFEAAKQSEMGEGLDACLKNVLVPIEIKAHIE
jgi:hypothetical protein